MLMAISGARVIIKTKRRQFSLCAPFQVNSQPTVNVQYYPGSKSVLCIVWINQQMVSKYSMNAWHSLASRYLYHMKGLYYKCLMLRNLVQRESNHIPDLESFRFGLLIPRFGVNVCVCVDDNLRSHPQVCPTWLVFFFFQAGSLTGLKFAKEVTLVGQWASVVCLPGGTLTASTINPKFFLWVPGFKVSSSCLPTKCFTNWVSRQAPG